ncbi:MAG: hypothetical protein ACYDAD_07875 [Acidimicrobiales bacterium]
MYQFAVVALLALAAFKIADLLEELVPALARFHTLLVLVIAVAGTSYIDYSLFRGFHIGLRESWMGPFFTGLMVGAMVTVWHTLLGWLGAEEHHAPREHQPRRPQMAA